MAVAKGVTFLLSLKNIVCLLLRLFLSLWNVKIPISEECYGTILLFVEGIDLMSQSISVGPKNLVRKVRLPHRMRPHSIIYHTKIIGSFSARPYLDVKCITNFWFVVSVDTIKAFWDSEYRLIWHVEKRQCYRHNQKCVQTMSWLL